MNSKHIPYFTLINIYITFCILVIIGHTSDFINYLFFKKSYHFFNINGFKPIFSRFESFYIRHAYSKIADCFDRPITGYPGVFIDAIERKWSKTKGIHVLTDKKVKMINFGSYNYLGFANNNFNFSSEVINCVDNLPVNTPGVSVDIGTNKVVRQLEIEMAAFLEKEDCVVYSMGFGTNSYNIPVITQAGDLILSDELNHMSIIYGARLSRAVVKTYAHNDVKQIEATLRYWISQGQPKTHKAWNRIFLFIEGIYSMEGTIVKLQEIVALKKKYKFYIFMDEAHSIGAVGRTGRGVCELLNVDFSEIDYLMGTFTKSFSGFGGYIACSKKVSNFLRTNSDAALYGEQMSPIVATQILEALRFIRDKDKGKLQAVLQSNSIYMRTRLISMGYIVYGDQCSPIIPLLIFNLGKIGEFSRLCKERGVAIVVVGYPATGITESRVRFCMSASHTISEIDNVLLVVNEVGKILGLNLRKEEE